jgi:hypothetical protein
VLEDGGVGEDGEDDEEVFEVWPENVQAVELFSLVASQWRAVAGFAGARFLGLDYAAIEAVMRMRNVRTKERGRLFDDLRVMEGAALAELNRKRDG